MSVIESSKCCVHITIAVHQSDLVSSQQHWVEDVRKFAATQQLSSCLIKGKVSKVLDKSMGRMKKQAGVSEKLQIATQQFRNFIRLSGVQVGVLMKPISSILLSADFRNHYGLFLFLYFLSKPTKWDH